MALETLIGVTEVGGYDIVNMDELRTSNPEMFRPDGSMHYHMFEEKIRPFKHIYVRHDKNSISFTLQNGPIGENGANGCQVDALIHVARAIIDGLNKKYPCRENSLALTKLDEAVHWLDARTKDREKRGVEGQSKA